MIMHWPQLTMAGLMVFGLAVSLVKHGEPSPDRNFYISLLATAASVTLLYFGGFWG